jgi:predicted transcriptional regulator
LVNRPKKDLKEDAIDLRRDRVLELTSQGYSQRQIANILQVGHSTVGNDVTFLRQRAKENIKSYVEERLPEEYEKCLVGITSILREAWTASHRAEDNKEKIQALSLAKECYSMKLDLLTNATVVKDAMRFVSEHNNNNSIKNEKVAKIDNDSELLHNAAASADAVTTINKVF